MVDLRSIWLPSSSETPCCSLPDILRWESYYGLVLPTMLKALLSIHDGGEIDRLGTHFEILPLSQVRPLSVASMRELFWMDSKTAMNALCEAGVPVLWLVFPFARDDLSRVHLLCYPAHSIKSQPLLFEWDHGAARRLDVTPDDFMDQLAQVSELPAVTLDEGTDFEVVGEEVVESPLPSGGLQRVRQLVGRTETEWVCLRSDQSFDGELVVRDHRWRYAMGPSLCLQACHVSMHRTAEPGFAGSWALPLEARQPEEVSIVESYRTHGGLWQSREAHGSPSELILFESLSETALCELRQKLVVLSAPPPAPAPILDAPNVAPLLQPDPEAVTQSLRKITDGALRAARSRLSMVAAGES